MKKLLLVSALLVMSQLAFSARVGAVPGAKSKLLERNFKEYDFNSEEQLKNNGVRGYTQFGLDTVTFESDLEDKNQLYPYAKVEIFPFANSNFYIDAKTAYRFDYNKSSDEQSKAKYTEFHVGQIYRNGNLFVNYKLGVNNYNFSNVKIDKRTEVRFVPRASYTFNDQFSWYLRGYLGYVEAEEIVNVAGAGAGSGGGTGGGGNGGSGGGTGGGGNGGSGGGTGGGGTGSGSGAATINTATTQTKIVKHTGYLHKLETGFTYRPTEELAVSFGALNRTKEKYAGEYIEWLYISKLEYNLYSSERLEVIPYFWYLHAPNGQSALNRANPYEFKDESGTKIGFKLSYEVSENWNFESDIFWNRMKKNVRGTGANIQRDYENAAIVRLGVKRYF